MSDLSDFNTPPVLSPYEQEMQTLVDTWEGVKQQIADLYSKKDKLEYLMALAMREEKASEFPHGELVVTYKAEKLWVEQSLSSLKGLIEERGLDLDEYLSKPVERKFDKRKLTKLAKQGGAIREVIEAAHVAGEPVLKVKKS